jgi:hypothetical protein
LPQIHLALSMIYYSTCRSTAICFFCYLFSYLDCTAFRHSIKTQKFIVRCWPKFFGNSKLCIRVTWALAPPLSTPCPPIFPTFPSRHQSSHDTSPIENTDGTTIKISALSSSARSSPLLLKIELLTVLPHFTFEPAGVRGWRNFQRYICMHARRPLPLFVITGIGRRRRHIEYLASASCLQVASRIQTRVRPSRDGSV